jgi:23S rRNA pseudouridine2605 synthase
MMTENENWREDSGNEYTGTNREGNQYNNREGRYNRPSYNNREGRPYRPRINAEGGERQPRNYGSSERPFRPRFNNNGNSEGYRPRYNNEEYGSSERLFRPRYNNNNEGYERPQRNNYGEQRSYRPRYNNNGNSEGYRPRYNNEEYGSSERPFRPRYNNNSEGYRPRHNSEDGEQTYGSSERPFRPRFNGNNGRGGYNNNKRNSRPRTADYNPHAKYSKKKQIEYKEQFIDPNEPIRLNKYLANAGVCSRREADEYIQAGVVSVNGEVVTELGTKIKRGDEVKFHDQTISIERKIYVLLNKPKDTVTTADDPQARRTVLDLVKGACEERIYPVGRLDRNTTGVLLLTNDGDLASKLTHPSYLKKKIYHVHLDKNLTQADMEKIAAGLELEDGEIQVDAISYTDEAKKSDVGVEIHSGKNRIVRRIFESLGYKVVKLDRVYFAGLTKKGLRRGDWRFLNEHEVNYLRMGSFE